MDNTRIYNSSEFQDEEIKEILKSVYYDLEKKGYNPINQITGYLLSGDPGYISSYNSSRKKITKIERTKILESLLREYLK